MYRPVEGRPASRTQAHIQKVRDPAIRQPVSQIGKSTREDESDRRYCHPWNTTDEQFADQPDDQSAEDSAADNGWPHTTVREEAKSNASVIVQG